MRGASDAQSLLLLQTKEQREELKTALKMSVLNQVNRKTALAPIKETMKETERIETEDDFQLDYNATSEARIDKGDTTRILIVDDNRFNILGIETMLE